MLSKIGKPNSPPLHLRTESAETSRLAQKLSLQTRDPRSQRLAGNELSPSASLDPVSRWITGPTATGLSPGARQGWRGSNMDARSPSNDSTATSLTLDPELFMPQRNSGKPVTNASNQGNDEAFSTASRSQRGSYDQIMFTDQDSESHSEGHGALRNLNLTEPHRTLERRASRQGMKRRALSPPSEMARDDKPPAYPTELFQKISAPNSARSPASAYRPSPTYGSASSAASSIRQNSYTSSFAPSLTGSSLTSISSYERQSPSDPSQPHQYLTSAHLVSSPATSIAPTRKPPVQNASTDSKAISRKMSIQTAVNEPRSIPATRIGSFYICECCPKKPKKFDSEAELRYVKIAYMCLHPHGVHVVASTSHHSPALSLLLTNYRRQITPNGETVLVSVLQQSIQEQERSGTASELPPPATTFMVLCRNNKLPSSVPPLHSHPISRAQRPTSRCLRILRRRVPKSSSTRLGTPNRPSDQRTQVWRMQPSQKVLQG